MCFDRNINGNRDVKFLECDYLLMQRCVKLTFRIRQLERDLSFRIQSDKITVFWEMGMGSYRNFVPESV